MARKHPSETFQQRLNRLQERVNHQPRRRLVVAFIGLLGIAGALFVAADVRAFCVYSADSPPLGGGKCSAFGGTWSGYDCDGAPRNC